MASFIFCLTLSLALGDGPEWIAMSVWALIAFLLLGIFVALAYLMEDQIVFLYGLSLAIMLPFLFFLKPNISAVFALLALLFFLLAGRQANGEKLLRLKFAPIVILRRGLAPAITGLAIMSSLIFYGAPLAQSLGNDISVPRRLFDAVAGPAVKFALQMNLPAGMEAKSLPTEFEKQKTDFLDKIYVSLNEQIEIAGRSLKKWIPLGAAVSLFFTFKVIGMILSWFITLLTWLVFKILLWSGVIRIEKVAAEKEIITI